MTQSGYVHVYTGNGKGKTTAAFGLALRALLSGKSVYIAQFVKDMKYNETKIANYFENIVIKQFGAGCFINTIPTQKDIDVANCGLLECEQILSSGKYDLVILDEITIALYFKLFDVKKVVDMINSRNSKVEVVITGRYAPESLIEIADLVTNMEEIKHYYSKGIEAREGIER